MVDRFLLPKDGCTQRECEDAIGISISKNRFCVADGATEGFDSRYWARLLVRGWLSTLRPAVTREQFEPLLCSLGLRFVDKWKNKTLPWYAEEKAQSGAFAAFVGINFFRSGNELRWQAIALGDSCLIIRKENYTLDSFPVTDPTSFSHRPKLVPSSAAIREQAIEHVTLKSGCVDRGDIFLLLSDAAAAWYLENFYADRKLTSEFECLLKQPPQATAYVNSGLTEFITTQRRSGKMRNDDVAAVIYTPVEHSTPEFEMYST